MLVSFGGIKNSEMNYSCNLLFANSMEKIKKPQESVPAV
jgi:hypothetical protein